MTSRPTILIAPHRPALGSTTRSPPPSPAALTTFPAASTFHLSGQSCWWGEFPPLCCHWDVSKDH